MSDPQHTDVADAPPDAALIEMALQGDGRAFGRLVARHQHAVYATALAVTRDFEAARDIAQEVFVRAWLGLRRLHEPGALAGWLRTIARNRARTWQQRREQQAVCGVDVEALEAVGSPAVDLERQEERRLARAALGRLPERTREALVLHYMADLPTPRIAALLGMTDAAVRQRLHRGRRQMRQEVTRIMADTLRREAPGDEFADGIAALLQRSREIFRRAEYRTAVPLLEEAARREPDDVLVALLLADAYTHALSVGEMGEDRRPWQRAMEVLDAALVRHPGNLELRLRRASLNSVFAPSKEVYAEGRAVLDAARGTPYEGVALLELGRRYSARRQHREAQALYGELLQKCPDMACVAHSELGVASALGGDVPAAIRHFEDAVAATTPESMGALQDAMGRVLNPQYATFWDSVGGLEVRQGQNHAWLAGLRARQGELARARQHLRAAVQLLQREEVGPARPALCREFVARVEGMFPELAREPEVETLRRQAAAPG